jgi:hypothetical protein
MVDPAQGELNDVACPAEGKCVAVDTYGGVLSQHGHSWTRSTVAALLYARGLACPSTSFCAAVTYSGTAAELRRGSWHKQNHVFGGGTHATAISCASSSFCVATDDAGRVALFNGATWSHPERIVRDDDVALADVSCTSPRWCMAVDRFGTSYRFDGSGWTPIDLEDVYQPSVVSCTSADFCAAGGDGGDFAVYDGTAWTTTYDKADNGVAGLACSSPGFCLGTDNLGHSVTWNGTMWKRSGPISAGPVACWAVGHCLATDGQAVATFGHGTWSQKKVIDAYRGGPVDISCATAKACVIVDEAATATRFDGSKWRFDGPIESGFPYPVVSVSCPNETFCAAVTSYPVDSNDNFVTFNGHRWTSEFTHLDAVGISCTSSHFCMTAGYYGFDLWNGDKHTNYAPPSEMALTDVSCADKSFCVATDEQGEVSVWNGHRWSRPQSVDPMTEPGSAYVACASNTACEVVNSKGFAVRMRGSSWSTPHRIDTAGHPTSIACAEPNDCVAVDGTGHETSLDGNQWSDPRQIDKGRHLIAVSCPTHFCAAVDGGGRVIIRQP